MSNKKEARTCIIVGAGIAGLAASIRMSAMGWNVIIFEANEFPGGKIAEKRIGDFRFDTGPSLLTKPEYINELFNLCGKNPEEYIRFEKIETLFRFYFSDGTSIDLFADPSKMEEELRQKTSEPFRNVSGVLKDSKRIYELTHEVFLERSLHKFKNYFNWSTVAGLLHFYKVRTFETMHHYNSRKLKDKRLVQMFDRYASYNGSDPFQAPATLNVINHFELNEGVYLPSGGMKVIISSLVKLAEECGVQIRYGTRVDEIAIENRIVRGVMIGSELISGTCVVCNVDIHSAYDKLLPSVKRPDFILKQPRSSSAIVFLWGLRKSIPSVGLHTTFFGEDDTAEFSAVFKEQLICDDPSVYVYNSSAQFPEDAPQGKSNWFVMVTAPYDSGQDWEELIRKTRRRVLKKLEIALSENIETLIEAEEVMGPNQIEDQTGSFGGSIYGASSNGIFSAFLRHPNFRRSYKGLYFCGGSVHPGAGIPLCLLSAKIVSLLIEDDF